MLQKRLLSVILSLMAVVAMIVASDAQTLKPLVPNATGVPELERLDATIYRQSKQAGNSNEQIPVLNEPVTTNSLMVGPLTVSPVYVAYLDKVTTMSEGLLILKDRFDKQQTNMAEDVTQAPQLVLSLQELGAMTQRLSVDNRRFKSQFMHGEEKYQSYQLIEQAVTSLEDAIAYWRLNHRYRSLYRAEELEKLEDDELLTLKLQTALNAIDELKTIQTMRERLKKLEANTYP